MLIAFKFYDGAMQDVNHTEKKFKYKILYLVNVCSILIKSPSTFMIIEYLLPTCVKVKILS